MKRGFTLMELLIVILIVGLLAGLSVAALAGAAEQARESRTKSIIAKLDQLIGAKWESYRTRTLPIRTTGATPIQAAAFRLHAMRDLQRMELPDRMSDVVDPPADIHPAALAVYRLNQPALHRQYQRKATASWDVGLQSSECLYLIISAMHDGDKNALDFFSPSEIGDTDEDGMREILDGWGEPISFIRWPVGYVAQPGADGAWGIAGTDDDSDGTIDNLSEFEAAGSDDWGPLTTQRRGIPDSFDVLRLDRDSSGNPRAFDLRPLIVSSGKDRDFDLLSDNVSPASLHRYSPPSMPDNNFPQPFAPFTDGYCGTPMDRDGDGVAEWGDNITNHWQEP